MIHNFSFDEDVDFARRITILNPDGTATDLSGYSARLMVRRLIGDSGTLVSVTSATNNLVLHSSGILDIYLDELLIAELGLENVYDLEVIDSDGKVSRPLQGKMYVHDEGYNTYGSIDSY
jgi:hypothetical protein